MPVQRLQISQAGLFVVDLQERFAPIIQDWNSLISRCLRLIHYANLLRIPGIVTEQYPEKLGSTLPSLLQVLQKIQAPIFAKTTFSCLGCNEVHQAVKRSHRRQWIVCGIEAHVCVQQTVFDLLDLGYDVFLPRDALSSRYPQDRDTAFERMIRAGAQISTSESLMFEAITDSRHPQFKAISALVKSADPTTSR